MSRRTFKTIVAMVVAFTVVLCLSLFVQITKHQASAQSSVPVEPRNVEVANKRRQSIRIEQLIGLEPDNFYPDVSILARQPFQPRENQNTYQQMASVVSKRGGDQL